LQLLDDSERLVVASTICPYPAAESTLDCELLDDLPSLELVGIVFFVINFGGCRIDTMCALLKVWSPFPQSSGSMVPMIAVNDWDTYIHQPDYESDSDCESS